MVNVSLSEKGIWEGCLGFGAASVNGQESRVEGSMDLKIQPRKARETIREKTGLKKCNKPSAKVVEGFNA